MNTLQQPRKSNRGFASMDPEKQRAIARKGGESVPNEKRSFSQNPALAAAAGRKGGTRRPGKAQLFADHALASEAGRKGGHASHVGVDEAIVNTALSRARQGVLFDRGGVPACLRAVRLRRSQAASCWERPAIRS